MRILSHRLPAAVVTASVLVGAGALTILPSGPAHAADGQERIHIMGYNFSDAIILESDGRFAIIDSGEDNDYPDGSDPRYPLRPGVTRDNPLEARTLAYLDRLGVTADNLEFFLGTHAHSDHIGLADAVIRKYKPKRVYSPEYSDEWISNPDRLWDNQYIYDQMIEAAQEIGVPIIQHLSADGPVLPTDDAPHSAADSFDFGDMRIQIVNHQEDYKTPGAIQDANLTAWGVKVTAHGHSAFLAADIENTDGDEDRIAPIIGDVDVLKLGHHGAATSNSRDYLAALHPEIAFQTGSFDILPTQTMEQLFTMGTRLYTADDVTDAGLEAFVVTLTDQSVTTSDLDKGVHVRSHSWYSPRAVALRDGRPEALTGWKADNGSWYHFDGSAYPEENRWFNDGGTWYHLGGNARMSTGWLNDGGTWYYLAPSGAMVTGWVNNGGTWYYLRPSGAMATGWINDRGTWYHLASSGAMSTGWVNDGGTWYYLRGSGAMATGWIKDRGAWYYLAPSGAMMTGWINDRGTWYLLGPSGALV
ncbi:MBL fold metallo-hydrolase [Actinomyces sp. B33]|uniref:MBL fold metallo-hydrolase n=1 Tax=Actinomyces sp. B33 TaxID=2942131 RepID=UPI002341A412|nr:MBL fold metallo-hydrolase [Actinomyces sp. B33]